MNGHVCHSVVRRRKRKLPQHADGSRQEFRVVKVGKPKAQIEGVGHDAILIPVHHTRIGGMTRLDQVSRCTSGKRGGQSILAAIVPESRATRSCRTETR
jgi:hypothetical protein